MIVLNALQFFSFLVTWMDIVRVEKKIPLCGVLGLVKSCMAECCRIHPKSQVPTCMVGVLLSLKDRFSSLPRSLLSCAGDE